MNVPCKHCGKPIVQDTSGRGWRHGDTGSYQCSATYAEPAANMADCVYEEIFTGPSCTRCGAVMVTHRGGYKCLSCGREEMRIA